MASFGGFGGFPIELGGRPSAEERIYRVLKNSLGTGGTSNDDLEVTTIDGLWRFSRAAGLAAIEAVEEAAHWQAWPHTASDMIPEYEDILGILPSASSVTENERRQTVVERWTSQVVATYPGLSGKVQDVDPRVDLLQPDRERSSYVIEGMNYAQFANPGSFENGRSCTNFPNYSSEFLVTALIDVGEGEAAVGEIGRIAGQLEQMLDDVLPAWNDWAVATDLGFTLDTSLLDVTAFDE